MARDKERIKTILADLDKIWNKMPEMRLTQLLQILARTYGDYKGKDNFYLEDSDLEIAIEKYKRIHNIK